MKIESRSQRLATVTLFTAVFFLMGRTSHGALGESEASVVQDAAALSGTHKVIAANTYSVHEIKTSNKTVKEYVTANGRVFAVSWRGRVPADLSVVLGTYYAEFVKTPPVRLGAAAARANARAPSMTTTSKMKLFKGGHMGDVVGMAYDPDLLPSGVRPEELYK